MGFFDKLVEMKKEHDRKVEEEKENARLRQELKEKEEAEYIQQLEKGELVQGILKVLRDYAWFSESQGSWDSNRREIIITPIALYFDNYDKDVFFRYLCHVEPYGDDSVFYQIHRENYVSLKNIGGSSFAEKYPTPETRYVDEILEKYRNSNVYQRELIMYQMWEYSPISDKAKMKKFAIALKNALKKEYVNLFFSDVHENKFGFLMFEMSLKDSYAEQMKSI